MSLWANFLQRRWNQKRQEADLKLYFTLLSEQSNLMQFKVLDRWQGTNFTSFTLVWYVEWPKKQCLFRPHFITLFFPLRLSMRILLKSQQCLLPTVSIVSRMKRNRYEPTQLLENSNLISPTCSSSFFTVILFAAQFSNVPCFANSIQIYITVLKYFVWHISVHAPYYTSFLFFK